MPNSYSKHSNAFLLFVLLYFFVNCLYAVWSYSLTAVNLVLTSWEPFWNFQLYMWGLPTQTKLSSYITLVVLQLMCWALIIFSIKRRSVSIQWIVVGLLFAILPLVFSNNAMSHDVFNYIFNARMVIHYQENPHVRVAMDFPNDPWIRFMHNVHTPAPYWYGWTALSLIPYLAGLGKFLLTWLAFRVWSMLGLLACFVVVYRIAQKEGGDNLVWFAALCFHPLLLNELISNAHNDGWMMIFFLLSLWMVKRTDKEGIISKVQSIIFFGLSISTKLATVATLPVYLFLILGSFLKKLMPKNSAIMSLFSMLNKYSYDAMGVLLFLPLLTSRAQYFHPWYLSWGLLLLPLYKLKIVKAWYLGFSISALFRYLPWLSAGGYGYTDAIQVEQRWITWGVGMGVFLLVLIYFQVNKKFSK